MKVKNPGTGNCTKNGKGKKCPESVLSNFMQLIPDPFLYGASCKISEFQFPYMVCGCKNSSYFYGWLSGLNELIHTKCLEYSLMEY